MNVITVLSWLGSLLYFGAILLGTLVSIHAFRGYRRGGNTTMTYFAIGLGLVLVASPIVGIVGEATHDALVSMGAVATLSVFVLEHGLMFIGACFLVYALYAKRQL